MVRSNLEDGADEAIITLKSLPLDWSPAELKENCCIPGQLEFAMRCKTDSVATDDFRDVLRVWKDGRDFWKLMITKFFHGPRKIYDEVTTYFYNASTIIELLEGL